MSPPAGSFKELSSPPKPPLAFRVGIVGHRPDRLRADYTDTPPGPSAPFCKPCRMKSPEWPRTTRRYLIGDDADGLAAVFDPRPDVDCYLELAREKQVSITHIFATLIHADLVSGARKLCAHVESAKIFLIPNASHVFLGELCENLGELDQSKPTAVYCDSGYRASIATSILTDPRATTADSGIREVIRQKRGCYAYINHHDGTCVSPWCEPWLKPADCHVPRFPEQTVLPSLLLVVVMASLKFQNPFATAFQSITFHTAFRYSPRLF